MLIRCVEVSEASAICAAFISLTSYMSTNQESARYQILSTDSNVSYTAQLRAVYRSQLHCDFAGIRIHQFWKLYAYSA